MTIHSGRFDKISKQEWFDHCDTVRWNRIKREEYSRSGRIFYSELPRNRIYFCKCLGVLDGKRALTDYSRDDVT